MIREVFSGDETLAKIWWLGGIPVALAATAFTLSAEIARMDGLHGWGNFLDLLKLLVYAAWLTAAWRSAARTPHRVARNAGRLAVVAGVVTVALTV